MYKCICQYAPLWSCYCFYGTRNTSATYSLANLIQIRVSCLNRRNTLLDT